MKKLLLIMPSFMGYEEKLKEVLENNYEVTLINCDQFAHEVLANYKNCSKLRWGIRHLIKRVKERDQEKVQLLFLNQTLSKVELKKDYYQVVFCINGAYLSDSFYKTIMEYNPHAKYIYYAWDDVANLMKQSHIQMFDIIWTYNIKECKQNSWKYIPMFVQSEKEGHSFKDKYDIAFIGTAHSDRQHIAEDLYNKYANKYRIFFYLYDPDHIGGQFCQDTPLTYEQYLDIMRNSKALLDIPQITQEGPTTRSFDALLTKTKVITTNKHIKEYPIYSVNILIVDRDNIIIDEEFMQKPYHEIEYEPLPIPKWLKKIGLEDYV